MKEKKISDMYKLYRELPIFDALWTSMMELYKQDELPMSLVPLIVHAYDENVRKAVAHCEKIFSFSGTVSIYRILNDHWWFVLSNVTVFHHPSVKCSDINEVKPKKGKRGNKQGVRIGKFDHIKVWSYELLTPSYDLVSNDDGENSLCPYVVEYEKRSGKKKKKIKLTNKKTNNAGFNPLNHATVLGNKDDTLVKQDCFKPMPYNEKLRIAKGSAQDTLEIAHAHSTATKIDILKGRYRKKMTEYPYRCIEMEERKKIDLQVVLGKNLVNRQYTMLFTNQDRMLAEMATKAGGSLALFGHNIHVSEERSIKQDNNRYVRNSYETRRKNKIEHAKFNTLNNFSVIKEVVKRPLESETDIESSSDVSFDEIEQVSEVKIHHRVLEEKCRPKSKQDTMDKLKVEDDFAFLDDLIIDDRVDTENGLLDLQNEKGIAGNTHENDSKSVCDKNDNLWNRDGSYVNVTVGKDLEYLNNQQKTSTSNFFDLDFSFDSVT